MLLISVIFQAPVDNIPSSLYPSANHCKNEWAKSMLKSDTATMRPVDVAEAIGLMTRLPVTTIGSRGVAAAWAWPLAGACVALIAAIIAAISLFVGLNPALAAGLALATQIILTGALHEDGLADSADGLWGAYGAQARLDIMADSRIGAYGVIALALGLGFRWLLLASLFDAGAISAPLIATAALSRAPMVTLMFWLPPARIDGLSARMGRPSRDTTILTVALALLVAILMTGFAALPSAVIALLITWAISKIALAKIGGQTGDILGASQQLAEIGILMGLATILT
jgi:adenosylcobinamide-GDP ribazoletransferase